MNIGYAQNVVTPSLDRPVYLAGFGNNRRAQVIHDDLYVRALTLQHEDTTLILTALNLIGFFRKDVYEVIDRVRQKHPRAEILIACNHPHHGPDTMGLWGPDDKTSGVDPEYMSALKDRITATIIASLSGLQPALLKTTSVHIPGLAKNARNPDILDHELTLAQFTTTKGRPLVTLFNFPCHPEVLWEHNTEITADYIGYLSAEVEKRTSAPCLFFAGALGGMMTPDVKEHSFEEADRMGRKLAEEGLNSLGPVTAKSAPISIQKKEIKIKLTNILYILAFRRNLLPDVRDRNGMVHTEINLVKIGDLWLAAVPGEMFPKLGLRLKAELLGAGAKVAGVIGLANDELGYILPLEEFKYPWNPFRPGRHYEETNSIGKSIAPKIMAAFEEMIKEKTNV